MAGSGYAPATINHNLAVLRSFYDDRLVTGSGPVINPVPSATARDGQRPGAHHNPMQPFAPHRRAPLRQKSPTVVRRGLPDGAFDELFAAMGNDRDRALLAFYVSTGARASELLGLTTDRVDLSGQLIGVLRKRDRPLAVAAGVGGRVRLVAALRAAAVPPSGGDGGLVDTGGTVAAADLRNDAAGDPTRE